MKLKKLFRNIPGHQIKSSKDVTVSGISTNSKLVMPGNLFVAKRGKTHDGTAFIPEAIEAGASAVLTDLFDPSLKEIVQVIHPHISSIEGKLAAEFYQHPAEELFMVGITGTNGKTTTAFIVKYLLDHYDGPCGLIGTIEYIIGSHRHPATRTTPDLFSNHKMLREMCQEGCRSAVMEVTSHALDQGRVDQIDFDIAIFSNLTLDHLDYHLTMEDYCLAKNKLFRHLGPQKWAIVNQDSPWTSKIIAGCKANILTYGIDQPADLMAKGIRFEKDGTHLQVVYKGESLDCHWPLAGRFNVYNCLSAIAVALTRQIPFREIIEKMKALPSVRGRLEPVENPLGLKIFVDFAHSDDALKNVLQTLTEVKKGRILTVFGCGGDRDKTKRAKMGEVSESYSDFSIITSDNPRSEDPHQICKEIVAGFKKKESYLVEPDRRQAIQKAIEKAKPNDIILIAGKGHETYQIFAHKTIEFDDVEIAREICHHFKRDP